MNERYLRSIYLRLAGVLTLVVLLALACNAWLSHRSFERALAPQVAQKAVTIGAGLRALVVRAVDNGVGFGQLYGVNEQFEAIRAESPELSYLALTDVQGEVLHENTPARTATRQHFRSPEVLGLLHRPDTVAPMRRLDGLYLVSLPIVATGQALGVLHLGVDVGFVDAMVLEMLQDVMVVLVVSLFLTIELLHFMAGARLEGALRELGAAFERGASGDFSHRPGKVPEGAFASLLAALQATVTRINQAHAGLVRALSLAPGAAMAEVEALGRRFRFGDPTPAAVPHGAEGNHLAQVRAPLFVFFLAEELTRSFLPGYVAGLLVPIPGVSAQIVIGLPIVLFMLIVAIGQPFLGVYCQRVGLRRTMAGGAAIAAVGFVATALASTVLDLLLWRSLCALGYAMVFVAGQAYVLDQALPATRARSFAVFIGAIMAATVCGPSIGGILADNIGMRQTFGIAAMLAAASLLVIRGLPTLPPPAGGRAAARLPRRAEVVALVRNGRFMAVSALAAMPAKVLLTGVCFYLIPMYLLSLGSSQAMAGRLLMTYAVMMVVLGPVMAGLATSKQAMRWLVGGGLVVSGFGGLLMLAGAGMAWVFAAVVLIGLGQSMSMAAQSALLADHCAPEMSQLGEGVVYGIYRLLERLGNALGPLIAAVLVLQVQYRHSFVVIGGAVMLCGFAFLLATRSRRQTASGAVPLPLETGASR